MDPMKNRELLCPVCGFRLDQPAWTGDGPSDDICPSCGIQFGDNDAVWRDPQRRQEIYRTWRERWVAGGMKWDCDVIPKPADWNPEEQLKRLQTDG